MTLVLLGGKMWWPKNPVPPELPGDLRYSTSLTPRSTTWIDGGDSCTVIAKSSGKCWLCPTITHCLDLAFEVWLCPTCHDRAWAIFYEEYNRVRDVVVDPIDDEGW